ncbi:hypothetical protein, partial [Acidovorax sp. CF316]|uniref:hypothetical protein n=1 Tax=Acidovorax sp. CF316 TaxID=1144317 RepID=UPI001EE6647B
RQLGAGQKGESGHSSREEHFGGQHFHETIRKTDERASVKKTAYKVRKKCGRFRKCCPGHTAT